MRGAGRVIFQTLDDAGNPILVALEIDQAIALLMAAADVTRGLPARMVTSTGAVLLGGERLVRSDSMQVRAIDFDYEARTR